MTSLTPIGNVIVAPVTWETCAYTARYVTKKLNGGESQFYRDFDLVPPFSLMSRKPGIARQYYDDHPEWKEKEYINLKTEDGGRKFRPPKYYEKLLALDDPDEAQVRSEVRKAMAQRAKDLQLSQTDLSYIDLLAVKEDQFKNRIKVLKRGDL